MPLPPVRNPTIPCAKLLHISPKVRLYAIQAPKQKMKVAMDTVKSDHREDDVDVADDSLVRLLVYIIFHNSPNV